MKEILTEECPLGKIRLNCSIDDPFSNLRVSRDHLRAMNAVVRDN